MVRATEHHNQYDYIGHHAKPRETPNLTVTAVRIRVGWACTLHSRFQPWFTPIFTCFFHRIWAHKPHPGPGFKAVWLIQAALNILSFIKADLKFFSLVYTWVKMSRGSKYRVSMGLTKPSHNRANPAASTVSILYIGEIHIFECIG